MAFRYIRVGVTETEYSEISAAASISKRSVSSYCRWVLSGDVSDVVSKPVHPVVEKPSRPKAPTKPKPIETGVSGLSAMVKGSLDQMDK